MSVTKLKVNVIMCGSFNFEMVFLPRLGGLSRFVVFWGNFEMLSRNFK